MTRLEKLIDTQNYLLSCIVKELACICDSSSAGRQTAGIIVENMQMVLAAKEKEMDKGEAK